MEDKELKEQEDKKRERIKDKVKEINHALDDEIEFLNNRYKGLDLKPESNEIIDN